MSARKGRGPHYHSLLKGSLRMLRHFFTTKRKENHRAKGWKFFDFSLTLPLSASSKENHLCTTISHARTPRKGKDSSQKKVEKEKRAASIEPIPTLTNGEVFCLVFIFFSVSGLLGLGMGFCLTKKDNRRVHKKGDKVYLGTAEPA